MPREGAAPGGCAGGYGCVVPVRALAGECSLFLCEPSMQQGGKWAVTCRGPETGSVKDVLVTHGDMG